MGEGNVEILSSWFFFVFRLQLYIFKASTELCVCGKNKDALECPRKERTEVSCGT